MKPLPFTKYTPHKPICAPIVGCVATAPSHSKSVCAGSINLSKAANQRGDMLIEALIGLVLMAIVAVGVTTITSKVEKGKREMSVQDLAISQLQELLVKNGTGAINLCDSTDETITLPDETITVVATGCARVAATVNGVALTDLKQPIVLSATTSNGATYTVGGVSSQ